MSRRPKRTGWRWHGNKKKAYVDVVLPDGRSHQCVQMFDAEATQAEIDAWRDCEKAKYGRVAPARHGFAWHVEHDYLPRIQAMPTIAQRTAHLELWLDALGRDRPLDSITSKEIDIVMQDWLTTPTNQPDPTERGRRGRPSAPTGLTPSTVKKRRAALRHFFNVVNRKSGHNPVRDTTCPAEPTTPDARGIPLTDAQKVIDAMPAYCWLKQGIRVLAKNKLRAAVMLWTGFPQKIIGQITRQDLALDAATPHVWVERRAKGQGVERRKISLWPQAVAALRALVAANALGPFVVGPLNVAVKRAGQRAGVPLPRNFVAYDLRHSFGGALYEATKDLALVGRAMLHAEHSTVARRYTHAAHAAVDAAVAAKMGELFAGISPSQTLPKNPAQSSKPRLIKRLQRA